MSCSGGCLFQLDSACTYTAVVSPRQPAAAPSMRDMRVDFCCEDYRAEGAAAARDAHWHLSIDAHLLLPPPPLPPPPALGVSRLFCALLGRSVPGVVDVPGVTGSACFGAGPIAREPDPGGVVVDGGGVV